MGVTALLGNVKTIPQLLYDATLDISNLGNLYPIVHIQTNLSQKASSFIVDRVASLLSLWSSEFFLLLLQNTNVFSSCINDRYTIHSGSEFQFCNLDLFLKVVCQTSQWKLAHQGVDSVSQNQKKVEFSSTNKAVSN